MRFEGEPLLRVLSLGAGVQSSTLYLMACNMEFNPSPDVAIFADTQWEPAAVYRHLEWLEAMRFQIPIHRVTAGNLREDTLSHDGRHASMPLHILNQRGEGGMLHRQCTREYKIEPIQRKIREMLGLRPRQRVRGYIESWQGISVEEAHRMRDNREPWIRNRYPLVERNMSRVGCVWWLKQHSYPIPSKSACIGCPYHDNSYWQEMKINRPEEWRDAILFDELVRAQRRKRESEAYLHRSLVPLRLVNLETKTSAQLDLWAAECEGMCGV